MKQGFKKSMFVTIAVVFFFCKNGMAQLGIGAPVPAALLDASSSAPSAPANTDGLLVPRVSAFPATNPGATQNGMLIYLTATVSGNAPGFYYWDNSSTAWKKIVSGSSASPTTGYGTPVVSAAGGTNLVYGAGAWTDNVFTNIGLTSTSDPTAIYNAATGTITIAQAGLYYMSAVTTLSNAPGAGSTFDGTTGLFRVALQVQPSGGSSFAAVNTQDYYVLRGATIPGGTAQYSVTNAALLNLQPGDQVKIQFYTFGAGNMNAVANNVILSRNFSYFKLFKL